MPEVDAIIPVEVLNLNSFSVFLFIFFFKFKGLLELSQHIIATIGSKLRNPTVYFPSSEQGMDPTLHYCHSGIFYWVFQSNSGGIH